MTRVDLSRAVWRRSSRSGLNGGSEQCVEAAALDDGRIAMRDSKCPGGTVLLLPHAQLAIWVSGVKAGDFETVR
ncbi:MAG: DUF397 domain-containing protein [Pseudonocardiales bacterium]|nr:DUF397 domain-containing protein [Pseudonocardiales bacterium]